MRIHIKTYGCQMNQRDSETAAAMLQSAGHVIVGEEESADLILLNTCSVRDQAERKAVGKLEILKKLKEKHPGLKFGVMGCMAQRTGAELLERIDHLNFALGTDKLHELPGIVARLANEEKIAALDQDDIRDAEGLGSHVLDGSFQAQISIMRGCNRFCTYCIVPYVRGRERSRSADQVVLEAEKLAAAGVKEIMLLGQNVAAYGLDTVKFADDVSPFAELLERISGIPGVERIRFTSPHPSFFNTKLIETIARLDKVCKSIHLPLQSGSDRILKAMNRPYTADQYRNIVRRLKESCPEIAFSTDVIVGFPGETAEDFQMTEKLMEEVGFDIAYIFKFSPRRGTRAALLPDDVPTEEKERRNQILLEVLSRTSECSNRRFVGRRVSVLAEGPSKRNPARWSGRTMLNKLTVFSPREGIRAGDTVSLKIEKATAMTLFGVPVEQ